MLMQGPYAIWLMRGYDTKKLLEMAEIWLIARAVLLFSVMAGVEKMVRSKRWR